MIYISKPNPGDIKGFSTGNEFDIENSMVIYDGKKATGLSYYTNYDNNEAILNEVFILPECRNQYFGDSIVKAILNVADKRGIKRMFIETTEDNAEFFKKVGFLNPTELDIETQYDIGKGTMIALLPDFFNTACRSKK